MFLIKRKLILPVEISFVIILSIGGIAANVEWKLKESIIVIGHTLNLECTSTSINNENKSRRWTGGPKNEVICFNGVTNNPGKYNEIKISDSKYILQIKETTEDDLDCPYSCRFGFQSDERILYVTEDNFNYIPNENATEIVYDLDNKKNYVVHLEFKEVFPEPVCGIQIENTLRHLTKTKQSRGRIFYHLTYHLKSANSLHACGTALKVKCTFGNTTRIYTFRHDLSCTALSESKSSISTKDIMLAVLVTIAVISTASLLGGYFYNRRRHKGKQYTRTNTSEQSANNLTYPLIIPIIRPLTMSWLDMF